MLERRVDDIDSTIRSSLDIVSEWGTYGTKPLLRNLG